MSSTTFTGVLLVSLARAEGQSHCHGSFGAGGAASSTASSSLDSSARHSSVVSCSSAAAAPPSLRAELGWTAPPDPSLTATEGERARLGPLDTQATPTPTSRATALRAALAWERLFLFARQPITAKLSASKRPHDFEVVS